MTATLEDRAAPEDEATAPVEDAPSPPPPPPPRTLMLAEAALIGVSLATVIGYARLFADGAFLVPIALAAVVGHLVAIALRRVGVGPLLSTIAHLALLPLVLTWARYWETSAHLLPTGLTVDTVGDDLAEAWKIFLDISAPVPAAPGFIAVAMVTAWVVALASDSLAFRLDATVEALAPATGLFLFSSILAEREHRTTSALLFVVAVLVFVLAARVARADGTGRWLATDAGRGARSLLAAGLLLAGLAVVPAVIAGPRLPGGDGRPLVDLDGGGGENDRVTLSPLVDIRSRLVEQSAVEAFRVDAAAPSYWRITALDAFDGQIWSSSGNYVGVDGRLPSTPDPAPGAGRLSQHFRIGALDQIWLPAAFEPVAVHSPDADVDWDGDSSSLVVATGRETSDGLEYDVLSILPRLNPVDLSVGTAGLDTEFLARFTRLPETTRPIARRFAAEAVGGATDAYGQALALQNWFRTHFRYSLDVRPGHGTQALAAFLDPLGSRSGYCEQFAGAYAALSRSLGLPSRVAVGFTPGEQAEDEPGTYIVRGANAHAWPEVYFAGVGWVPFEPTPGRGAPGAEAYTHVAPAQADEGETVVPTTLPNSVTTGSLAPRPGSDEPLPEFFDPGAGSDRGLSATQAVALALALVAGIWLVGVPVVAALRRARNRRRSHGHPDLEVTDAWDDSVRALALLDLVPHGAETPTEFATRAVNDAGTDRDAHRELALLTTTAAFGPASDREDSIRARRTADTVIGRARRMAGPWRRFAAAVSPRRLLGR
ncbi:MAG: transglutaminaseTgpA domain-containing protein [Acidimicrobiales bacterium]